MDCALTHLVHRFLLNSEVLPPPFISFQFCTNGIFLRYNKNQTTQHPEWDRIILEWCLKEAKENHLKPHDFMGGFVLDEMKVQLTKEY